MSDERELKLELAKEANKLGKHRLYAAMTQALLTACNLLISTAILWHVLHV